MAAKDSGGGRRSIGVRGRGSQRWRLLLWLLSWARHSADDMISVSSDIQRSSSEHDHREYLK
ncbi:hypothetical protein JYB64_25190, partial [Algoriphagus aestuarii]|nr:hypothetical protein [Algoriphagus aestuarii]